MSRRTTKQRRAARRRRVEQRWWAGKWAYVQPVVLVLTVPSYTARLTGVA